MNWVAEIATRRSAIGMGETDLWAPIILLGLLQDAIHARWACFAGSTPLLIFIAPRRTL